MMNDSHHRHIRNSRQRMLDSMREGRRGSRRRSANKRLYIIGIRHRGIAMNMCPRNLLPAKITIHIDIAAHTRLITRDLSIAPTNTVRSHMARKEISPPGFLSQIKMKTYLGQQSANV